MKQESTKPHQNHVVIYFDEYGKSRQVIHPTNHFDGAWKALVDTVTNGNYYSFKIL